MANLRTYSTDSDSSTARGMQQIGYCVLWMPTVVYKCPDQPIRKRIDFFELSDSISQAAIEKKKDSRLFATVDLFDERNIRVNIYKDRADEGCLVGNYALELTYETCSHNGMVLYGMNVATLDNPLFTGPDGEVRFPCAIYHKLKELYHTHHFHTSDDGDSMIAPFVSKEKVAIKKANNEALLHYLNLYEEKFLNQFEYLELYFCKLNHGGFWSKIRFFFGWDNHSSFYRLAMRIKGDKTYFNTLYSSRYNSVFRIKDSNEMDEESSIFHRKSFNICNISKIVDTMMAEVACRFDMSVARISFWMAFVAIILSVILSFVAR